MQIVSSAFPPMGEIPARYTCEGANVSPPLAWSGVPATARSLVLMVDDPDAPDPAAPKTIWTHWLLYNLPANSAGLVEGVADAALPSGTRQGLNGWQRSGYGGPCPPIGRHRYFHRLYALDTLLPDLALPDRDGLARALCGHALAEAQLVGTYRKNR